MILERFTFSFLAEALALNYHGSGDLRALRFSTDTRSLQKGDLFVALKGDNFDGTKFIEKAMEKGAVGVIASQNFEGVPTFLSENPLKCMQEIASFVFKQFRGLSIAITGSNGKTTVKEFVKCVHSVYGKTYATPGNYNNHIGLPLTIGGIPSEDITTIFEMGANKPGDIKELIDIAPCDLRVVCSIGEAHLEGFGDLAGVIRTKSEIFQNSTPQTYVCIPKALENILIFDKSKFKLITVGDKKADIEMQYLDNYQTQYTCTLNSAEFDIVLRSPFAGQHNALNLGLALATLVAAKKKIEGSEIQKKLKQLKLPGGRSREREGGGHLIFDDAYNANPASVKASLSTWLEINPPSKNIKRIAMIGEMFEMGEEAQKIHEALAQWIGKLDVDVVVFIGHFHESMVKASHHKRAFGFIDAKTAAKWLRNMPPAKVFLKGSRGMKLETIIDDL